MTEFFLPLSHCDEVLVNSESINELILFQIIQSSRAKVGPKHFHPITLHQIGQNGCISQTV